MLIKTKIAEGRSKNIHLEDVMFKYGKQNQSLRHDDLDRMFLDFSLNIRPNVRELLIREYLDPANTGSIAFDNIRRIFAGNFKSHVMSAPTRDVHEQKLLA